MLSPPWSFTYPNTLPPLLFHGTLLATIYQGKTLSPAYQPWSSSFFLPPDHQPLPISPKWHSPFKLILMTPTAAKLEGLSHWVHLSHLKPFIPPPKNDSSSYTSTITGPCSENVETTYFVPNPRKWGSTLAAERAWPHWIRHRLLVFPLLFSSIQVSPYIWRFEVQETPTDNSISK